MASIVRKDLYMKLLGFSDCQHNCRSEKHHNKIYGKNWFIRFLFPLIGLVCIVWWLVRVIPKPSRAQYPCMKVAAPMAGGFLTYIVALLAAMVSFKKARHYFQSSNYIIALALVVSSVVAVLLMAANTDTESYALTSSKDSLFTPIDSSNSPIGKARGIIPGRVVWMWDSAAARWNGTSGNWWSDANTNQVVVDSMISKSICALTGKSSDAAAWILYLGTSMKNMAKETLDINPVKRSPSRST